MSLLNSAFLLAFRQDKAGFKESLRIVTLLTRVQVVQRKWMVAVRLMRPCEHIFNGLLLLSSTNENGYCQALAGSVWAVKAL